MEPRARTVIERFGFADYDRKRYSHDEMQIWTYRNFRSIVKSVFPLLEIDEITPLDLKLEYPVTDNGTNKNYIVGFIDVYCRKLSIGVEIKTEIPIVGDLIRQIQFYRKYIGGAWIVVSPDERNVAILKEQGINIYKYNPRVADKDQLYLFQ